MFVDAVNIIEWKNDNLLWPNKREASRWHHSKVVRIVELQLVGSLGPKYLQDKTSKEVCSSFNIIGVLDVIIEPIFECNDI